MALYPSRHPVLLGVASPIACLVSVPVAFGIVMSNFDDPDPQRSPLLDGLVAINLASVVTLIVAWFGASRPGHGVLRRRVTVGCAAVSAACAGSVVLLFLLELTWAGLS